MTFDRQFWSRYEGQTVDSVYPLERCVRVTADGAMFDTRFHERPATIRLAGSGAQRESWNQAAAAELSHPSLVDVLARGEDRLGDQQMLYLVMERADDNLAEVLAERPLTTEETLETIQPVIAVLRYLESRGFAHADLSPASVFAFGEQIKVAGDDLVPLDASTAAAQSRAIGTLVEKMLGGARPKNEPLSSLVRNCRKSDTPWTLSQIDACLRGEQPEPAPPGGSSSSNNKRGIYLAAAVAIVALAAYALRPAPEVQEPAKATEPPPPPVIVKDPEPAAPAPVRSGKPSPIGKPPQQARETVATTPPATQPVTTMDGVTQVMPEIPAPARNTINGRVRINVRVQTDDAGRVTQATLLPPGASKYFTDRVLAAAKAWRFPPGAAGRGYTLGFELSRQHTNVSVAKGI